MLPQLNSLPQKPMFFRFSKSRLMLSKLESILILGRVQVTKVNIKKKQQINNEVSKVTQTIQIILISPFDLVLHLQIQVPFG